MRLHSFLFFCLVSLSAVYLPAQNIIDGLGHMPTPHATDLGRFGDISVSYYTGRANITIPIRSFSQRGVTLDVSLSYDTSGLPVNKLPGWVGPGWTLNAGGAITRVRHNYCDEMTFRGIDFDLPFYNYFHSYSDIINQDGTPNWTTLQDFENYISHDYTPDIFYFNFMGKSGSFFLGNDGEWKVSSEDNLVVDFNVNDTNNYVQPIFTTYPNQGAGFYQPNAIKGFTIFDDDGNRYIFGGSNASIDYSMDLFRTSNLDSSEPWVATAWYLTEVTDRNGKILYSFSYTRGKYFVQLYYTPHSSGPAYSGTLNLPVYLSTINIGDEENLLFTIECPYTPGTAARTLYPSMYDESTLQPKSLTPGVIPNCQYQFYYLQSNSPTVLQYDALGSSHYYDPLQGMDIRFLSKIRLNPLDQQDSIIYRLNYDDTGRRHLSSLSIENSDGRLYNYSFDYYNYEGLSSDYLTDQHDYWGYFNKIYNPETGGHQPYDPFINQGEPGGGEEPETEEIPMDSIRKPDLAFSKMGMLKEIRYPTGGKSVLDYELNDYSFVQCLDENWMTPQCGTAGGLRIRTILEYDDSVATTPSLQRSFSYLDPSTNASSGQFMENEGQLQYYSIQFGQTLSALSVPIIPLCTSLGTHIGYSCVTESINDRLIRQYKYTNYSDVIYEIEHTHLPSQNEMIPDSFDMRPAINTHSFLQGKLLKETVLDADSLTVRETSYSYRIDRDVFMQQFSYGFNNLLYIHSGSASPDSRYLYKLYYPKYDVVRNIQSTAWDGVMVADTTLYTMSTLIQIPEGHSVRPFFRKCTQEQTSRKGNKYIKSLSYSLLNDYFTPVTQTKTYENSTTVKTDRDVYGLFNGIPQLQYQLTKLGSGPTDTLVTYHDWDIYGRLNSFTRKGEYTTHLFWKPSTDHLLASVTGPFVRSDLVCPALGPNFSGDPLNVIKTASGNQSIFCIPDVNATTYLYDDHGRIISSATANGQISKYLYDYLGRLTEIRDANNKTLQRFTYNYSTSATQ